MYKHCLLLIISMFFLWEVSAQGGKYRVLSVPVKKNGVIMRDPWVGGVNAPQFSSCDINQDGIKDLFIFDREGNKVLTYIGNGTIGDTMFTYAPEYEDVFPRNMNQWCLIRDYNNDGVPDVFTYAGGGTSVYKGSVQSGLLHFDLVCPKFTYSSGPFTEAPVFTNYTDIPVLTDVNRDGDLDILSYDLFGSTVGYYENQTKEHPGNSLYDVDSFKFIQVTSCWGNFSMAANSNSIELNISCKGNEPVNGTGNYARHAGNSIYGFDEGNDHDVDLLNGNIGYNNLILIKNCGDSTYANACEVDSVYPLCDIPVNMQTYPAAYGVNLNSNNYEDLLIAPNQTTAARDVKNVMLYRNTNNISCPFEFESDSFLVHHMLDFGTESKALFYDFNGDGLKDIVVGNYGYFRNNAAYKSSIAYYSNSGTANRAEFTLQTEDVGNISAYGFQGVNPAFGDLDGDGHDDMIIGEINGYLHYFKNASTTGSSFPVMTSSQYFSLHPGTYSAPFIYDINGDSLNDLIVGREDGKLSYYWNYGTRTSPQFSADSVNNSFGNVNVIVSPSVEGFSQPYIMRDTAGALLLLVGSRLGNVYEYLIDTSKLRAGSFQLVTNDFLKQTIGYKSTISVADINSDGQMEYLVGNSRGGLMLFSDSVWDPEVILNVQPLNDKANGLIVFPNPVVDQFTCVAADVLFSKPQVDVYNAVGQKVSVQYVYTSNKIAIQASLLPAGLYIVRISDGGRIYSSKVTKTGY